MPERLHEIVEQRFDDAGLRQREDVRQLNEKLRTEFEMARGILFTNPDPLLFSERLREVGFYAEWRQRFGDEVWALLEQYVGNLT